MGNAPSWPQLRERGREGRGEEKEGKKEDMRREKDVPGLGVTAFEVWLPAALCMST